MTNSNELHEMKFHHVNSAFSHFFFSEIRTKPKWMAFLTSCSQGVIHKTDEQIYIKTSQMTITNHFFIFFSIFGLEYQIRYIPIDTSIISNFLIPCNLMFLRPLITLSKQKHTICILFFYQMQLQFQVRWNQSLGPKNRYCIFFPTPSSSVNFFQDFPPYAFRISFPFNFPPRFPPNSHLSLP